MSEILGERPTRIGADTARRVLLIAPSPPPYGGMALQARLLQKLLKNEGNSVVFIASNLPFPKRMAFLERIAVVRTLVRALIFSAQLCKEIRRVEVVHIFAASWVYFFLVVYPAVLIGRLLGTRVILNCRGGEARSFFRWFSWAVRPAFALADVVTAPSGFLAEVVREFFGVPVLIVPNILDTSMFRFRQRADIQAKMLVTRHLEEIYDIEAVLKAFEVVQGRHPEASLWIAGTGSQDKYLRGIVAERRLRNVGFLGHVAQVDLPAIFDQRDILVNASRVDNFPGALLEGSAAGLVVVSTGAGGIPHMYKNLENALLVEPGDWQGLSRAVEEVLATPTLASRLTNAAMAVVQKSDWREVRKSLYEGYGFLQNDAPEAIGVTEVAQ